MSTRIVNDLEHGAMILIHDLDGQPTPGETVPEEALGAVQALADRLGLSGVALGPVKVGWLFDLLNHAIEAISSSSSGSGHAQAGSSEVEPPAAPETEVTAPPAPSAPEVTERATQALAETAVGGVETPAQPTAPAPETPATPAVPSPEIDDIVAKAQQQWAGGGGAAQ